MARIVVVEDDTPLRQSLVRLLTSHGHAVTPAASAEKARLVVERVQPDLLIVDLHLPGLDGETFVKATGARGMTLPTILISGSFEHDSLAASAEHPVWRIRKPFSAPVLLELVRSALQEQGLDEDTNSRG